MAVVGLAVIPKSELLAVHTGNIVNWNSLKRTINQSATEELVECIGSVLETWFSEADKDSLQHQGNVVCMNTKCLERIPADERLECKITVKIFANRIEKQAVADAVNKVMSELEVSSLETVILSVPQQHRKLEDLQTVWRALEELVESEKVFSLGISDLSTTQLEELYNWALVKPSINQVNLTTCCVIPPELSEFAREHDIQLLTHSDPPVILSTENLQTLICSKVSEYDAQLWQPVWVTRYSVLIKCRGVIKSKGYIMQAKRNMLSLIG